ncbi:MAG: hypothetical protein ACRDRQ_17310 [Pseudonocardiaceae bacterium]
MSELSVARRWGARTRVYAETPAVIVALVALTERALCGLSER